MTRIPSSAVALFTLMLGTAVCSLRSSLVRIAQGRPLVDLADSRISQGMGAVPSLSSSTVSVLLPRNDSMSAGTRRVNSVRPIWVSVLVSVEAVSDEVADEPNLHRLRAHLVARTFRVDDVMDLVGAIFRSCDQGADEIIVGAAVSGLCGPRRAPVASRDGRADGVEGRSRRLRGPAARSRPRLRGRDRVR